MTRILSGQIIKAESTTNRNNAAFFSLTCRMCNVLTERSRLDEERMEKLMSELKDARLIAEDADAKSDEIARKLQFVEEELEAAEERVKTSEAYA